MFWSDYAEMFQRVPHSVIVYVRRHIVSMCLHAVEGIARRHTHSCRTEHRLVVASVAECHRLADGDAEMGCHGCYSACFVGFARCDVGESRIPAGAVARRCAGEQLGLLA